MYCKKCGQPNEDALGFCTGCGAPIGIENLTVPIWEQTNGADGETESLFGHPVPGNAGPAAQRSTFEQPAVSNNAPNTPALKLKQKKKKSTVLLIITIALVLIIGAAAAALFGVSALNTNKYDELIDTGNKYLEELKYEEAVETFLDAIDIKPKREEAYVGAANGYIGLDDPENARDILEEGLDNVKEPTEEFKGLCDELGVVYEGQEDTVSSIGEESVTASETATGPDTTEQKNTTVPATTQQNKPTAPATTQLTTAPVTGTIKITSVSPSSATAGVETTFSVTVNYTSTNAQGCIIYAGANTNTSSRYTLYDEYQLPNTSGSYTFNFICTPTKWDYFNFGIYVNISEYPHPDSWSPFADDVYPITLS